MAFIMAFATVNIMVSVIAVMEEAIMAFMV
jgi:hypothetical protein